MKPFFLILGLVLVFAGVVFGLWAGVWWAFIGGAMDVISQIKADEMDALVFGCGVLKFLCAGLIGWVSGIFAVIPGIAICRANV